MLRACIALLALAAIGRADDGAAALHAEAMAHARAGRLHEALPLLRAAARERPLDAQLLSDLGVTEMRLRDHARAHRRLARAVDDAGGGGGAGARLAAANLEELEAFLKAHCRAVDADEELHKHRYWDMFQGAF